MKKLIRFLIIILILLSSHSCASLYVYSTADQGVQPHVKKEMIKNEKRIREDKRKINKLHIQRKREIKKAQQKSWK